MARKGVDPAHLRLVKTIGAAVIGALLGALLRGALGWTVDLLLLAVIVLVAIAVSTIVAMLLTRETPTREIATPMHRLDCKVPTRLGSSPQLREQQSWEKQPHYQDSGQLRDSNSGHPSPSQSYSSQPDLSRPHLNQSDPSRAEPFQPLPLAPTVPTHAVIEVDPPQAAPLAHGPPSEWWNQAGPHPMAASTGAPQCETPDISNYVGLAQIVQCSKCAAFTVDVVKRVDAGFSFRCQKCGHEFTWRRDEEWPAWKVSPRSRSNH
jgi:hypothetical protein